MIHSRRSDRPARHLDLRVKLFAVGALLALAGMYLDRPWLLNVAIGVLVGGFFLRFVPERGDDDEGEADETEGAEA